MAIAQELLSSNVLTMCVTEDDFDNFFKSAINFNEDFIYEEDNDDIPVEVLTTNGCDIRSKPENNASETASDYNKGLPQTTSSQSPVDNRKRSAMLSVNEIPSKKKKIDFQPPKLKEPNRDIFCWKCHKFGLDILSCRVCPRVYHFKCTQLEEKPSNWLCFECSEKQKSKTNIKSPVRLVGLDQFSKLLTFVLRRMRQHEKSVYFENPVDLGDYPDYRYYIVKPMCLYDLEQNIINNIYYSCESFLSDAQWLVHNSYIFNTAQSELTIIARSIMKMAKHECGEINNCPDCYLHANTLKPDEWFLECCRIPHILVWARLKGWPYWPCKVMSASGINVDVRFFGDHNRAVVPADSCYLYSKQMPGKQKKCHELELAIEEARKHIEKLENKFGKFTFPPPRVDYVPKAEDLHRKLLLPEYKTDTNTLLDSPSAEKLKLNFKEVSQLEEKIKVPEKIYKNSKLTFETPKKTPIKTHSFSNKLSLIIEQSDFKSSKILSNFKQPSTTFEKPCPASKKRVKFSECIQVIPIEKLDNLASSKEDAALDFCLVSSDSYSNMSRMNSEIDRRNKIKSILRSSKKYTEPYEDPKLKSYCSVNVEKLKLDPDCNYKAEVNLPLPRKEGIFSSNTSLIGNTDAKTKCLGSLGKLPLKKTDIAHSNKADICKFLNNLKSDASNAKFIQKKISQNRGNILYLNNKPLLTKTSLSSLKEKDIKINRDNPVSNVSILNEHTISSVNTSISGIHKATSIKCPDEKRPVDTSKIKICHNEILKSLLIPNGNTFLCANTQYQSNENDKKINNSSKKSVLAGLMDNKSTPLNEPKKVIKILGPRKLQESLSFTEKQINNFLNNLISDIEAANSVKLKILGNRDSSLKSPVSNSANKKENLEKSSLAMENQRVDFGTLKKNSQKHELDYSNSMICSPKEVSNQNIALNTFHCSEKLTTSLKAGINLTSCNLPNTCSTSNLSKGRLSPYGEGEISNTLPVLERLTATNNLENNLTCYNNVASSSTNNISVEKPCQSSTMDRIKLKEENSSIAIDDKARKNIKNISYKDMSCNLFKSDTLDLRNTAKLKTLNRTSNSKPQNILPENDRQVSCSNITKNNFLGNTMLSQNHKDLLDRRPAGDIIWPFSSTTFTNSSTERGEKNHTYDTIEVNYRNDQTIERKIELKVETQGSAWDKTRSNVANTGIFPDDSLNSTHGNTMENHPKENCNLDDLRQLDILLKQWNLNKEVSKIVKTKVLELKKRLQLVPKSRLTSSESFVNVPKLNMNNLCVEESSIKLKDCATSFSFPGEVLINEKRVDQKYDKELNKNNHAVFDETIQHRISEEVDMVSDEISTEYMVLDPVANIFTLVPELSATSPGESDGQTSAFTDKVIKYFCQACIKIKNQTIDVTKSDSIKSHEHIKPRDVGYKRKEALLSTKIPLNSRIHELKESFNQTSDNCNLFIHSSDPGEFIDSFEKHSDFSLTEKNGIKCLGGSNFGLYSDIENKSANEDFGDDDDNKTRECLKSVDLPQSNDTSCRLLNGNTIFYNRCNSHNSEDKHIENQSKKDLKFKHNGDYNTFENQPSTSNRICDEIEDSPLHNELYELTEWSLNLYFNNIIESIKAGNAKTALDHSRTLAQEHSKLQEMFNPHIDDKMEYHKKKFIEDVMYEAKRECKNLIDLMKKTQLCSICQDPVKVYCCFTGAYCSEQCKNRHFFTHHKECSKIQLNVEEPSILSCTHLRQFVQKYEYMKVKDLMECLEKFPHQVLSVKNDESNTENPQGLSNEFASLESDSSSKLIDSDSDLPLEVIISSPPDIDTTSENLNSILFREDHTPLQDEENNLSKCFDKNQINMKPHNSNYRFYPVFKRNLSCSQMPQKRSSHLRNFPNSCRKLPIMNNYHTTISKQIKKFRSKNYFQSQKKSKLFSSKRALALSSRMKLSHRHIGLRHQMQSRQMAHSYPTCSRKVKKSTIASEKPSSVRDLAAEERLKAVYITMLREKMKYIEIPKKNSCTQYPNENNTNVNMSEKWKHINLALVNKILIDQNSKKYSINSCHVSCKGNCPHVSNSIDSAQPSTSQGI